MAEPRLAGQVLERLAGRAPGHQRVVRARRASAGTSSTSGSRDRSVPRTWASSSAASCSGLGTPASRSRSPRPPRASSRGHCVERGEPVGEVQRDAGVEDRLQVAVEHLVEVVGLVAGAVVGDAVLREVVGADPLGAVDGADLAAAGVAGGGVGLLLGGGQQPGAQDAHRLLLVLQLALLVLAADHDPGRDVGDADRGVGGVDALAARAAAAEDVDAQVVLVDRHVDLLGLGQHQDAGRAGVHPALRLGDRHPLHAVHAALELQQAVRRLARLGGRPSPSPRG